MKTLIVPAPKTAQEAAQQARVLDRAIRLFLDGYTYRNGAEMFPEFPHFASRYVVTTPQVEIDEDADPFADTPTQKHYIVDVDAQTCTCPYFAQKGFCKHYLAIEKDLLDVERMEEEEDGRLFAQDYSLSKSLEIEADWYE